MSNLRGKPLGTEYGALRELTRVWESLPSPPTLLSKA